MSEAVNPKAYPLADAQVRKMIKIIVHATGPNGKLNKNSIFAVDKHYSGHRPAGV